MNEASRLLDGELTDTELSALLERLEHDTALRDEVSAQQLISDGVAGLRSLDAGYTLRILDAVSRARQSKA